MSAIYEFLTKIVNMFPQDPIAKAISEIKQIEQLGYLNYFVPVSQMVEITGLWVSGMVAAKVAMFLFKLCMNKV